MKWQHVRKGIIEGEIVREDERWADIKLSNKVHMGHGDPGFGRGFREIYAVPGQIIRVRKLLLRPLPVDEPVDGKEP